MKQENDLTKRRAVFVYEAARLAAARQWIYDPPTG
jgi:hypothetical protein